MNAAPRSRVKNDTSARRAWGDKTYASIPKSVFALLAWHLANVASDAADAPGEAERRAIAELVALMENQLLDQKQGERAKMALENALNAAEGL